ncbi:hypothetical protein Slin15195_G078870 [Septoria linicola]|uniref:Uncharacterized protein n=1 Tax=Septoria linicola TaxID=215465 RepID=A0A9Q9AYV5_9PEZI|nr:hypothetical protein Slin14017_G040070 [Septoria linicola]USW54568.1 hypothetical protein Slin15195_G078870 [Septoria linicola]
MAKALASLIDGVLPSLYGTSASWRAVIRAEMKRSMLKNRKAVVKISGGLTEDKYAECGDFDTQSPAQEVSVAASASSASRLRCIIASADEEEAMPGHKREKEQ